MRSSAALVTAVCLLAQSSFPPRTWATQEPITEVLLQHPQGAPAPGRLWPGFAAAKGLDTGANADPSGPKPEQIDTGASADPSGNPPETMASDLSPGGVPSGGDLSGPTVPWLGSGAPAPNTPATPPLTGGTPTSGGTSLGGGTPTGGGSSLPSAGQAAAGLLGATEGGAGGTPGSSGQQGIPGLENIMGMVGMLAILSSLPQLLSQLPQILAQALQSIGQMVGALFQIVQSLTQALGGNPQGLMGMGAQLAQSGGGAGLGGGETALGPAGISGAAGGVAGAGGQSGGQGSGRDRTWKGYVPTDIEALRATLPEQAKYLAETFVQMGQKYNIDPLFLVSISHLETGRWSSNAFLNKNNGMGISNASGPTAQASAAGSIETMARSLSGASGTAGLYTGANTVQQAGLIYCPPGAPNDFRGTNYLWGREVGSIYDNYAKTLR